MKVSMFNTKLLSVGCSFFLSCLFLLFISPTTRAQTYPNRQVRIIVPFGSGGPDSVARIISQQLAAQTGQSFIVENRAGANGIIGSEVVAKSAADGYTLLLTTTSFSVNPSLYKKLPFDTIKDFIPISNIADQEAMILFVTPTLPVYSIKDLIAYERQSNSGLSYASIGIGNTTHLAMELFLRRSGLKATHIPYKGGAQAVSAVMAGEVQMMMVAATQSIAQIKAGRVRAIAYAHPTRAQLLPDVPTFAESGVSGADFQGGRFGLFTPAATPVPVVEKLASEVKIALSHPMVLERFKVLGLRPIGSSPEEFRKQIELETKYFAEVVRETAVHLDQ